MYDHIRGLKTEVEENLRGIDNDIALRSDGDVAARIASWNSGCHQPVANGRCGPLAQCQARL